MALAAQIAYLPPGAHVTAASRCRQRCTHRASITDCAASCSASGHPEYAASPTTFVEALEPCIPLLPNDADALCEDLTYVNDFTRLQGRQAYLAAAAFWRAEEQQLLQQIEHQVGKVTSVGPGQVVVKTQTTWVPEQLRWLVRLGRAWPGQVRFYNILDRYDQVTKFRWAAVAALFAAAARDGYLRLPHSAVTATLTLTLAGPGDQDGGESGDAMARPSAGAAAATADRGAAAASRGSSGDDGGESWGTVGGACPGPGVGAGRQGRWLRITRIEERLDLLPMFESERVRNRRVARDMVQFLDTRRPPGMSMEDWTDAAAARLNLRSVPGMGFFDVEGLDEGGRAALYDDAGAALALATVAVLTLGGGIAWAYLSGLQHEAALRAALEGVY